MLDRLFEITARVASFTGHIHMAAAQRKIRQIMVELVARHFLPPVRAVTPHTVLAKAAAMRILVARHAVPKSQSGKLHKRGNFLGADLFRRGLLAMAFRAVHLLVATGQRKLCPIMQELRRRLPAIAAVASPAIAAQLPAMFIGMAAGTVLRQREKCLCHLNVLVRAKILLDEPGLVAITARQRAVFPGQGESGLRMIETAFSILPKNQLPRIIYD